MMTISIVVYCCVDQGEPSLSSFTEIHIYIQGVNDHVPRFTQNKYLFEVSESMPSGTIVGQLSATDSDRGIGGTFQFSLEQNNSKCFGINASSGVIYTMREIDRENISEYEVSLGLVYVYPLYANMQYYTVILIMK